MKKTVAGITLLLCAFSAAAHAQRAAVAEGPEARAGLLAAGELAPAWRLTDAEGRAHSLSEYRGRVVVLDFWATWCGPCAKVMPRMEKLHRKYAGQGVVVFGVSSWETGDAAALMKKKKYTYGLLLKGEEIAPAYGVAILPAVCAVGVDGRVIYCATGAEHKGLASAIDKHLQSAGHD